MIFSQSNLLLKKLSNYFCFEHESALKDDGKKQYQRAKLPILCFLNQFCKREKRFPEETVSKKCFFWNFFQITTKNIWNERLSKYPKRRKEVLENRHAIPLTQRTKLHFAFWRSKGRKRNIPNFEEFHWLEVHDEFQTNPHQ